VESTQDYGSTQQQAHIVSTKKSKFFQKNLALFGTVHYTIVI
jgi:hypothetical protein